MSTPVPIWRAAQTLRSNANVNIRTIGLVAGPVMFFAMLLVPAPADLSPGGWHVAALLAWMVLWWCTDAVPAPMTALLPFPVLPSLGVMTPEAVARAPISPILFLLLGGAVMAIAAAKTGLHLRLAQLAVRIGGGGSRRLVLAVMAATAFTGMWVSTTMTTLFMVEIATVLAGAVAASNAADGVQLRRFSCALVIGVAYAAAFGGFATLTGNLFNGVAAGMISRQTGEAIGFLDWLRYGLPIAILGVPLAWALLVGVGFRFQVSLPERTQLVGALGAPRGWSPTQIVVAAVMACVLTSWLAMPLVRQVIPVASDAAVAIVGAILMFLVPANGSKPPLDWKDIRGIPWGILLIVAGTLTLGAAISATSLDLWLAQPMRGIAGMPPWLALLALVAGAVLLTELVNNIAMVTIAVPAGIVLASAVGVDPVPFAIAAAIGGLGGFVLPGAPYLAIAVATPPVRVPDLVRAGLWLMLLAPMLITAVVLIGAA